MFIARWVDYANTGHTSTNTHRRTSTTLGADLTLDDPSCLFVDELTELYGRMMLAGSGPWIYRRQEAGGEGGG